MPQYDPNKDIPLGIAAADFPVTFYDRPQLAFENLIKGNVDATTRAIFAPQTLTPNEMVGFRSDLLGKNPNKLLKAITDIATNPLVIIGLAVGMWKFPIGSTRPLLDLTRGLIPKANTMGKMMSGLHPAIFNLRTVPGMYESLLDVVSTKTNFLGKHIDDINKIFSKAGRLSKSEGFQVAARLDGLHTPTHSIVNLLGREPEIVAVTGGKNVAIAGGIKNKMRKETLSLSDNLRGWLNRVRSTLKETPGGEERIKDALAKQGLTYGDDVKYYFPRNAQYDKYYLKAVRSTTKGRYKKFVRKEATVGPISGHTIARTGGGIPNLEQLALLESEGVIPSGYTNAASAVFQRWGTEVAQEAEKVWTGVQRLGLESGRANIEFVNRIEKFFTKGAGKKMDFAGRFGGKATARDTLYAMAESLSDARIQGEDFFRSEIQEIGRTLGTPRQYTLDIWDATQRYANSSATVFSWHGTGAGQKINQIAKQSGVWGDQPWLESYVFDDLVPHVMGLKSFQELQRSISFSLKKAKVHEWVKTHPAVEKMVGTKGKEWLMKYTGDTTGSFSAEGIGANIAHWFHLSTLGANISPASKNSLQTLLTTMNVVGPQGMYRGLKGVPGGSGALGKMQDYIRMITVGGKSTKEAFGLAFPEYVADMGEASQIVESLLAGDVAKEGFAKRMLNKGVWEKVKTAMLMPFSTSEGFNRLLTYYTGRNQHIYENAHRLAVASTGTKDAILKEAGKVGQTLTMTTQFTGGPLGIPRVLMNTWAPWRQFMHFPTRFAAFLHGSLRMGADPSKLDWGTVGRTMAGSTAIYLGARDLLGVDLSSGLAVGALPIPSYEGAPFYPFPLVPPAVSVAGIGAKALLTGEAKNLETAASLMVPGGVSLRKLYKSLSPKYAGYKERTPEGRIPIYNDDHALIGTMSPWQLTLQSMGLKPMGLAAEQGAAKWVLAQRDKLRAYRRDYMQALMENDLDKANRIQTDYQKAYPELGPIKVKKSDITALENRRQMTRLTRIQRGLPSAYRPLFNQIVSEAGLSAFTQNIDAGPTGLENYLQ